MIRVLQHLRSNLLGWIALFVALTGTSVAAVGLASHSITPSQLNGRYIGGYVRGWVSVSAAGRVIASGGRTRVVHPSSGGPGVYAVNWSPRPTSDCTAIGSVDIMLGTLGSPGYVIAETIHHLRPRQGEQSGVTVYNAQGQPAALPFDLELLCATPR